MKQTLLTNWNLMRLARLVLGIAMVVEGIRAGIWMLAGLGALFSLMALLRIGCCAGPACAAPAPRAKRQEAAKEVIFEEVTTKDR